MSRDSSAVAVRLRNVELRDLEIAKETKISQSNVVAEFLVLGASSVIVGRVTFRRSLENSISFVERADVFFNAPAEVE